MAFGNRTAVTLVMAAVALLPMACGGGDDEGAMRATLTDDGCTYEGDTSPAAGMFTIEVENKTEFVSVFTLATIAEGSTIDDLEAYIEQAQRQVAQNGRLPALPSFYEQTVRTGVEAGETGTIPVDVTAGTYVLSCIVDELPTWRAYVAEQLDVTE